MAPAGAQVLLWFLADGDGVGDAVVAVSAALLEPPDMAACTATPLAAPRARTLPPAMTALRRGVNIMVDIFPHYAETQP